MHVLMDRRTLRPALLGRLGGVSSSISSRPRRRRLEAYTTDTKLIRLISRHVTAFPKVAARQFFDGDCDAADLKIFPG